jgi:hypothetical protein
MTRLGPCSCGGVSVIHEAPESPAQSDSLRNLKGRIFLISAGIDSLEWVLAPCSRWRRLFEIEAVFNLVGTPACAAVEVVVQAGAGGPQGRLPRQTTDSSESDAIGCAMRSETQLYALLTSPTKMWSVFIRNRNFLYYNR